MENATKALLIAGAVAVTLLILSLGMYFYNTATEGVNLDKLSQAQKDEFNGEYKMYDGNAVSGTQVNTLIQKVINSNKNEATEASGKFITLTVDGKTYSEVKESSGSYTEQGDTSVTNKRVQSGFTYKVVVEDKGGHGLIDTITVTKN